MYYPSYLNAIEASSTICERSSFLISSSVSNSCDLVHLNICENQNSFYHHSDINSFHLPFSVRESGFETAQNFIILLVMYGQFTTKLN